MENAVIKDGVLVKWEIDSESITIPKNVTQIKSDAFERAYVAEILVDEENEHFTSCDGVLFTKDMKTLVAYPKCKEGKEYIIPQGVTGVGRCAFYEPKELKRLVLPSDLNNTAEVYTFWDFANIEEFVVPEGVTKIGEDWFLCCDAEKIALPSTLEEISPYAFCSCYAKKINIHKENKHFKFENGCLYDYEKTTLIKCFNNEIYDLRIVLKGVEEIYPEAFSCCKNLTEIEIPEGVIEIPQEAFWMCTNLEEVKLPSTLETIGAAAFCDTKIKEIVLPEGLKEIMYGAFEECDALEKIVLPDGTECAGDIFGGNYFVEIHCRENSKAHKSVKKHMPVQKVKFL